MRRIIFRTLLLFLSLGALGLIWIFGGRHIALVLDRLGTAEIEKIPIAELSYEGAASGGLFRVGGEMLSTTGTDNHPFPLSIVPEKNNKLILVISGQSFPLGEIVSASAPESAATFTVRPEKDDEASLVVRRSFLSWPTPFEFNFMTGNSPSWKRHRYHQLVWKKRSGAKLEMVWRYEQYFYPGDTWVAGNMTREGTTGLIKAEIKP
jgi:hypothetical protein